MYISTYYSKYRIQAYQYIPICTYNIGIPTYIIGTYVNMCIRVLLQAGKVYREGPVCFGAQGCVGVSSWEL